MAKLPEDVGDPRGGIGKRRARVARGRLTRSTQQHLPAVLELRGDDLPRDLLRPLLIGKREMLGASQQDVAACRPFDPRLETAVAIEPDQAATIFGTTLDQERRHGDPPKDDDPAKP